MSEINNMNITELIDSINSSIEDMREHSVESKELPSNFEIMIRGIQDAEGIESLFSPKIDRLIMSLFSSIEKMDYTKIIENKDIIMHLMDGIFGEGSFRGPVSTTVLNSIQSTIMSQKYNEMKSHLGKSVVALKKINLVLKNLQRNKKNFEKGSEEYKKYTEAVDAIKAVLKFTAKIYRNRKIINKKVYKGLRNIVHEAYEIDEALEW